ncbi:hypothetical protein [Nesterenkonia alba]|uniref:hypothetical protein n=1 Tax=Nesterenkonia alba TaxID=515814 RepID=UPI0003B450AD|nr:hypothetical protein [Nesterenkonia alba]
MQRYTNKSAVVDAEDAFGPGEETFCWIVTLILSIGTPTYFAWSWSNDLGVNFWITLLVVMVPVILIAATFLVLVARMGAGGRS